MLLPKQSLREELGRLEQAGKLVNAGGYYFLPGRQELVAIRQRRYNYYFHQIKNSKTFWAVVCQATHHLSDIFSEWTRGRIIFGG